MGTFFVLLILLAIIAAAAASLIGDRKRGNCDEDPGARTICGSCTGCGRCSDGRGRRER